MAHCAKNDCYISCSFRKLYPDGPGRRRTRAFSVTRLLRAAADVAGTSRAAIRASPCTLLVAPVCVSSKSGYQSPSLPDEYANGSDGTWKKCVVSSARVRAISPVLDPLRKDLGMIAFVIQKAPAVVAHDSSRLTQRAEGHVRTSWHSRLVAMGARQAGSRPARTPDNRGAASSRRRACRRC